MDFVDWASIIAILITGVSALIGAALDTEHKPDQGKRAQLFKRLNRAGWVAVALALASTTVSLVLNLRQRGEKAEAKLERTKAQQHAERVELELSLANKEIQRANQEIQRLNDSSKRQEGASNLAARAFSDEAKRAQTRWLTAEQRAEQATGRLLDEQQRSQVAITKVQQDAATTIQDKQTEHQQELRRQQDIALVSLLGQVNEKPQALVSIPFNIPEHQFSQVAFNPGVLSVLLLGQERSMLSQDPCPFSIQAKFASLRPRVPDPSEEVIPYGWDVLFCWMDNDLKGIGGAGPQEPIPPIPSMFVVNREAGGRLVAEIRSGLKAPVSASTLFASSYRGGDTVMDLRAKLNDSAEVEDLKRVAGRWENVLHEGVVWLLIDSKAGFCSRFSISRGSVDIDTQLREVRTTWQIMEQDLLLECPYGLFTLPD